MIQEKNRMNVLTAVICALLVLVACKKSETDAGSGTLSDEEELGQQVGDLMASIDESGGSSGSLGLLSSSDSYDHSIDRLEKKFEGQIMSEPDASQLPIGAYAACGSSDFGTCSSNVITRTFSACTIGSGVFSGTVTLTWATAASACTLTGTGGTITRVPNFTVTGRRGATLTVSKTAAIGQRITWSSGTGTSKVFSFTNDGIRRVFATAGGATLLDITTTTTSAITVTGTSRSNRVLSGGTLRLTNNSNNVTCDVSPTNITWSAATCNCPRSGTWSGSCSNGNNYLLTITGCGTADLTVGSTTTSVAFDRCSGS